MSYVSSRRLRSHRRSLPWDVLAQIFQQADTPTLAILGMVSLDFLAATSRLLCKVIEIVTQKQLNALFCERKEASNASSPSRINAHLNLTQLRVLSFELGIYSSFAGLEPPKISSSRMLGSGPLPLDLLQLSYYHDGRNLVRAIATALFPKLNPLRFAYGMSGRPSYWGICYLKLLPSQLAGWNRLERADFRGSVMSVAGSRLTQELAPLPTSPLATVRLQYSSFLSDDPPTLKDTLYDLQGSLLFSREGMRDGWFVVVVKSEKEKEEALAAIEDAIAERWRTALSVEIEA